MNFLPVFAYFRSSLRHLTSLFNRLKEPLKFSWTAGIILRERNGKWIPVLWTNLSPWLQRNRRLGKPHACWVYACLADLVTKHWRAASDTMQDSLLQTAEDSLNPWDQYSKFLSCVFHSPNLFSVYVFHIHVNIIHILHIEIKSMEDSYDMLKMLKLIV